jgi:undecaprenyl-diphosphatase
MVVLVLAAVPVDPDKLSGIERKIFVGINSIPGLPFVVVWPVMQLGMVLVIPAAALAALAWRRYRLSLSLFLAGATTYVAAKLVKRVVTRGRPSTLVDSVHIHGVASHGLGFVSGHAAVTTALATAAWPYLGATTRKVSVAIVVVVGLLRVYVGAHLPLDVVGGVGLGLAAGAGIRLALGRPCS